MARKIILLRAVDDLVPGEIGFSYAMWADVPSARQARYANANATSAVTDASAGELTAIQTGAVTERVASSRWPSGTTIAQVQGFLVTQFNTFQGQVTSYNPWQRTGTSWDGTSWTVANNG